MGINAIMDDMNNSFRFGSSNGENPDRILKPEPGEKKINGLNKKVVFSVFFAACLIAGIFYYAYNDIRIRSITMHKTGAEEIKKISENIEAQFKSISEMQKTSEIEFNRKISSIISQISSLKNNLAKTDKKLKRSFSSMAKRKETKAEFNEIKKTLASIDTYTKNVASKLKTFDTKASAQFIEMEKGLEKLSIDLIALKTGVFDLLSSKVDIKKINGLLENHQKRIEQKVNLMKKEINTMRLLYEENMRSSGKTKQSLNSGLSEKDYGIKNSIKNKNKSQSDGAIYEEDIK